MASTSKLASSPDESSRTSISPPVSNGAPGSGGFRACEDRLAADSDLDVDMIPRHPLRGDFDPEAGGVRDTHSSVIRRREVVARQLIGEGLGRDRIFADPMLCQAR